MPNIKVLPQEVADKIAAGEVAERPSAVVKELVENSIDAGATSIEVEIRKGGIEYIRVCDNGCGIEPSQVETAFLRHATSKLNDIDDLYSIATMGFRGEALSSICAVAEVEIITRTAENDEGVIMHLDRGKVTSRDMLACGVGTTMVVEKLFENIPARMKFLKKDSTEAGYVADVLGRIALSKPDIAFTYICDDKEIFATSGDGKLQNVILKLYGIDHAKAIIPVEYEEDNLKVCGVLGKPEIARGNRSRQTLFVNGRYVKNHVASKVVAEGYRNSIMVGKFPFFVLDIQVAPEWVDVNVHPAKTEIKFANENRVYEILHHAVSNALRGGEQKEEKAVKSNGYINSASGANNRNDAYKTTSGNTRVNIPQRPPVEVVKEYLDSVIPKNKPIIEENKEDTFFSDRNFLEEEKPKLQHEIRETDANESVAEPEEVESIVLIEETKAPVPIGQVFETYILCQGDDVFYMIDQHAAHERMRFEELKKSYYSKERMSQLLLVPMILKLDFAEVQTVLSNLDVYTAFGFDIEDFGSGSIIVNATPIAADENTIRDLILEIAEAISEKGSHSVLDFEERALDMIACKYAIKANHRLNLTEMQDLINKVWDMDKRGIRTCPHGRPIRIEFSKDEIEKMFKRKL
ncbi:MAG: DNA mismatch repair endonuclease MutL [Clostridia bacterium]|nr:DNA mismatch repair endonuclease MutL [Clostridia bacterium]